MSVEVKFCKKCNEDTPRRKDGYCKKCDALRAAEWRKANPGKMKEQGRRKWENMPEDKRAEYRESLRKWTEENKERRKEYSKQYHIKNKEKINERARKWVEENPDRQRERTARYHAENPEKATFRSRKRRDGLANRRPCWADEEAIKAIYKQAADFRAAGIDVEVDHIYPLQGEFVSGLHCAENLQIIPARENRSKQNRYIP